MSSTNSLPPPCTPEVAESLGLAGLTVLPMPKANTATTVHRYAEERRRQLNEGTSVEETLIFTNATTAGVDAVRAADRVGLYPGRFTFFGNKSGLLFIRMPRPIHEQAHRGLFREIITWASKMGLDKNCRFAGSSTYKTTNGRRKEGDDGLRPNPPRESSNCFPTLVVETGNSESRPVLLRDRDWWFDNSPPGNPRGDVRVVITIKICSSSKRIVLEQWHRGQATASQTVVVKPNPEIVFSVKFDNWQTHWIVEGAPLEIKFEDVFLRQKEGEECDFVLNEQGLAELAMSCWE